MIRTMIFSILVAGLIYAQNQNPVTKSLLFQTEAKQWCPITGLDIQEHLETSYLAKLNMNKRVRQYSSLYALVKDMQEYGILEKSIKVFDLVSKDYISATGAFFVLDSKKKGTLSKISKFAFSKKDEAVQFQKKFGGRLVSFEEVLSSAKESLKSDESYFLKLKKKREYPRGEKVFQKLCKKDIELSDYLEINELKEAIVKNKFCKKLNIQNLHSLALYLWEVKRFGNLQSIENRVVVEEHEKCPVCGMFTYKYPRWAAQIFYEEGDKKVHYSFDGVKDLMKFYFDSQKWGKYPLAKQKNITKILVTDYYSQQGIDGKKAYYVIRSDIYGPMGHELIPFSSYEDAQTFKKDHFGKKILKFDEITEAQTYKLDFSE